MRDVTPIIAVAKEAAQNAALAKKPEIIEIEGIKHIATGGSLTMFKPPRPVALQLDTLQGIVDYIKGSPDKTDEPLFLHVVNYRQVLVLGAPSGPEKARTTWVSAIAPERWTKTFRPDHYYQSEQLIIWLLQAFAPSEAHARLLNVVGGLKAEKVVEASDNGLTQAVAIRAGIQSKFEEIQNPYRLRPHRTFPEIESPFQTFIVRVKNGGENEPPLAALFDADSGQWEVEAIAAIKAWLKEQLPDTTIIG